MKFILFILLVSLNLNVNVQANSSKYRGGELKLKKTNNDICFYIDNKEFIVERDLENIIMCSCYVDGEKIDGKLINQLKYETLDEEEKKDYLQFKYEKIVEKYSGLQFDDLIFFVNEIFICRRRHRGTSVSRLGCGRTVPCSRARGPLFGIGPRS